jgi:hypothetical protein
LPDWQGWAALVFAIGLVVAILLPGQAGVYLDTLLFLFFLCITGFLAGAWLRRACTRTQVTAAGAPEDVRSAAEVRIAEEAPRATEAKVAEEARRVAEVKAAEETQGRKSEHRRGGWPRRQVTQIALRQIGTAALKLGIFGEKLSQKLHHLGSRLGHAQLPSFDQPGLRAVICFPDEVDPPFDRHELEQADLVHFAEGSRTCSARRSA